jgi:group I intron endonuclease
MAIDKETWILYQTTNLVNHKIYVGVHKLLNTSTSRKYLGSGTALKPAIKKHGRENFTRVTLAEFNCAEDAYLAEEVMVTQEFVNRPDTYNMKVGGMGGKGLVFTEAHRAKIGAANKGRVKSVETRLKLSASNKGKVHSEETKAKIGAKNKGNKHMLGKKLSEETKAKISAAGKGRELSEEARARVGEANRTRVLTAESRAKISAANKGNKHALGRKLTDEHKAKVSAAHRGKIVSEETRAKLSNSLKGVNAGAEHCRSISIVINGNYYGCVAIAAKVEKVNRQTIMDRVKNTRLRWVDWRYATEEEKLGHPRSTILTEEILDLSTPKN